MLAVSYRDDSVGRVAQAAFPSNRKDILVGKFKGTMNVNSYWDGGSRDEYRLVNLETFEVWHCPRSHPYFDRQPSGERMGSLEVSSLPVNVALVAGGTFCGKPATVRVYLPEANFVTMIPQQTIELSDKQRKALDVICGIKGGYRKEEFLRLGLGLYSPGNPHIVELVGMGLLKISSSGAVSVTLEGKNARG